MMGIKAREGDFVETVEGLIFDVKGLVHPPHRVVAYVRYIPDEAGDRVRGNVAYRKVYPLEERSRILDERWPIYTYFDPVLNVKLQCVSTERVKHHYKPVDRAREMLRGVGLDCLERRAVGLMEVLEEYTGLPWECFGVSGSLLVGLHTQASDIDLVVYGTEAARQVVRALRELLHRGECGLQRYEEDDIRRLYEARSMGSAMGFEDFLRHESRKVLEGKFRGADYFIRCVKEWDEVGEEYGGNLYLPIGRMVIQAMVKDDSEHMLTPCRYRVEDVRPPVGEECLLPSDVVSFRGRFCEQVFKGESIVARGKLERVVGEAGEGYRLVVGGDPSDYIVRVWNEVG